MLHAAGRRRSARPTCTSSATCRDEELVAYYEVADLFLCASEHEGFCVPLVEAFYKQVPVLAYAATAVPATMDGAGVLYDDKDPLHVARADGRDRSSNAALQDADRRRPGRRASTGCGRRTSPARCCGSSIRCSRRRAQPRRRSRSTSGISSTPSEELEELRHVPAGAFTRRCRRPAAGADADSDGWKP